MKNNKTISEINSNIDDIEYQVVRMRRKSVSISLLEDGAVEVRAPFNVSNKYLSDFVVKKKKWIARAKDRQSSFIKIPEYAPKEILEMKELTYNLVQEFLQDFSGLKPKKIMIRNQKTVWGTCNSKGNISINAKCCLLPVHLFEYLLVHELCHLTELNHSAKFWDLVSKYIPDWNTRRCELKKFRIR